MTHKSHRNRLIAHLLLVLLLASFGCGKKREQNSFTTPNPDFSGPIGISNDLVESFPEYARAKAAMDREDWDAAADHLNSLMAGEELHAAFANDLGVVEMQRGNFDDALAAIDQSISLDPQYDRAYFNKGRVLTEMNRMREAIKSYKSAVSQNAHYYEAWYNLGLLHYKRDNFSEAKKAFLAVTEETRSSRFNNAYYQLGLIAANEGEDKKAVEYYSESLLLDPSHVPSYVNKATALLRMKKFKKALDLLQKAAALEPDNYLTHYNLGIVLRRLERFDESVEAYQQAVMLRPRAKKAWLNLGYVHAYLSDLTKASAAFERALEIDPDYENASKALEALQAGDIKP